MEHWEKKEMPQVPSTSGPSPLDIIPTLHHSLGSKERDAKLPSVEMRRIPAAVEELSTNQASS